MDTTTRQLISEIGETISNLQGQLDELKARLTDLASITVPDTIPETVPETALESDPEPVLEPSPVDDMPIDISLDDISLEPEPEKVVVDLNPKPVAVAPKPARTGKPMAWRTDLAGAPVKNIISAISLNDRVLFISTLFKEDPMTFQNTISALNSMDSFTEAEDYLMTGFPEWNFESEVVYRFMMAIRRKLR